MTEQNVFEKIRRVLIDDTTIKGYVQDRVYTAHVSSIDNPKYPAISLHLLPGQARVSVPDMIDMTMQIDLWFPVKDYTVDDVLTCYGRIRALLHNQNLSDTTIGVKIYRIHEMGTGPMMYDEGMTGHHLPARYTVVAI
jgi:hypothetical protein